VPVIDHWWQTETGWPIAANCLGIERLPVKHGSPTLPVPGWDMRVVDDAATTCRRAPPARSWPSCRCRPARCPRCGTPTSASSAAYLADYPGYYKTGDAGYVDDEGYVYVMARTDDIINVAGHRLSTGQMEEVLSGTPRGRVRRDRRGRRAEGRAALGLLVLKAGVTLSHAEVVKQVVAAVRETIGPVAAFKDAVVVQRCPRRARARSCAAP
jgi:propionyl-CoA synthetase